MMKGMAPAAGALVTGMSGTSTPAHFAPFHSISLCFGL
jgi:hypothetical protein